MSEITEEGDRELCCLRQWIYEEEGKKKILDVVSEDFDILWGLNINVGQL